MPLDAYFGSPTTADQIRSELNAVLEDKGIWITECMLAEGFSFYTHPADIRTDVGLRYGSRTDLLEEGGYGAASSIERSIAEQAESDVVVAANIEGIASLTGQEVDVFNTVVQDCVSRGYELFPEPDIGPTVGGELAREIADARQDMVRNDGFKLIWADWSSCMREAGYEFANRSEAIQSLAPAVSALASAVRQADGELPQSALADLAQLEEQENAVVASDQVCASHVDLDQRVIDLQYNLETRILEQNAERWSLLRANSEGD